MPRLLAAPLADERELLRLLLLTLELVHLVDRLGHPGRRIDERPEHLLGLCVPLACDRRAVIVGRGRG